MARRTARTTPRRNLCLAMIVKDEEAIIRRALQSAKPYVDCWCIHDTGSSDHTMDIVRDELDDFPGKLVTVDWQDFATNRTAVVRDASELRPRYILMMDADQTLEVSDAPALRALDADAYNIQIRHGALSYPHPWLLKAGLAWQWRGATHEYLECDQSFVYGSFDGLTLVEHADSHRRVTGIKIREDKALLLAAYNDDPRDGRTLFYLGQCCQDERRYGCAIRYYRERVEVGGWLEETWCAQYRIALCYEAQRAWEQAVPCYLAAYQLDPTRAEPLYRVARGYLAQKSFHLARLYFAEALAIPKPEGRLFLEEQVYAFAARWGLAMSLRLLGRHQEAEEHENVVLGGALTPARVVADIISSRTNKSIGSLPV